MINLLKQRLIGQDEVLQEISDLFDAANQGMHFEGQPRASVLILGPTGVGKTESVLISCEVMFGSCDPTTLARFDMSEFLTPESVLNLLGTPTDIGVFEQRYNDTGGKGFMLFDEIEKAHPDVLNLLLQILSAGRLSMSNGTVLNMTRYFVCATSNIGSSVLMNLSDDRWEMVRDRTIAVALQELRPEILNRFDLLAAFGKLRYETTRAIADLHINEVLRIMMTLGHSVTVTSAVREHIRQEGFSEIFGARPIRRESMKIISKAIRRKQTAIGECVSGVIDYKPSHRWIGIQ